MKKGARDYAAEIRNWGMSGRGNVGSAPPLPPFLTLLFTRFGYPNGRFIGWTTRSEQDRLSATTDSGRNNLKNAAPVDGQSNPAIVQGHQLLTTRMHRPRLLVNGWPKTTKPNAPTNRNSARRT